ncbi:hypothetical protein DNHGIG_02180 [Collibacillus ludicampi]|uniref:Uncharacterized protein n=1 Tax=Collibacillus ludicampi TaxID=2771369 RepID=A0AAV4LA11_9BACL|nr:hypothetical protein DNHGIG_02180 [Collibacillus ludicampi]
MDARRPPRSLSHAKHYAHPKTLITLLMAPLEIYVPKQTKEPYKKAPRPQQIIFRQGRETALLPWYHPH